MDLNIPLSPDHLTSSKKRKEREPDSSTDDDDDYDTDHEKSASLKKAKMSGDLRSAKKSIVVRKDTLESDGWTKNVGPHQLTCKACNKTIKLDKIKKYSTAAWNKHKAVCPLICGKRQIRSGKLMLKDEQVSFFVIVLRYVHC